MEETISKIIDFVSIYGIKIVIALLIFVIGKWVAGKVSKLVQLAMNKKGVDPALEYFIASLIFYGLMAFVIIAALGQVGIQTASFVAIIGAAGLAIGLALQGSLANFAAGFLILLFRPFKVGDFVEVAGTAGVVEKILIFTTELKTPDNKKIIIPNGAVTGGTITNYSANPTRRVDLVMGISYSDDIDKAKNLLQEEVNNHPLVLKEPAPVVALHELGDSSVNFVVRPWANTSDYWAVYWGLTESIKKRFDQEGISIPFPQRDVHLYQHSGD